MYDFIYNLWFIYNEFIWWEWEKNPEIYTNENQGKIPRLVALPSPLPWTRPFWGSCEDGDWLNDVESAILVYVSG